MREGQSSDPERSRSARRIIANLNDLARGRPDLPVAARAVSKQMSCPTEGAEMGIMRVIWYLEQYP